jgi:bifunctional non-homologous end joining protein LigD
MAHYIKPMLACLIDKPFNDKEWLFEIKWDGYRAIAEIDENKVLLYSRNLQSFNDHFPQIVKSLERLKGKMILDGEIVAFDNEGNARFQLLQNYRQGEGILKYCVFDILYLEDRDLRDLPLIKRKELLKEVVGRLDVSTIYYSDYVPELGIQFFQEAKKLKLEGIIGKKSDSKYLSKRSPAWVKIKTQQRQEAVICGFTPSTAAGRLFASLILGVYEGKKLIYAGHVGTGFDQRSQKELYRQLEPLITKHCPFKDVPKIGSEMTWVKPQLVAEISFQEWTSEHIMRQPVFHGLREDKPARNVHKEIASHESKKNYR